MDVNLEIRHLKLIAAIAEEKSVTAAAKRLFLTQSALSHQLRDAEERLGTALFLRLGKSMAPTAAGEKLIDCARRLLGELREAESHVRQMNGGMHGVIRLSTECYTCYHWLPPVLERFHVRFPKIEVCIDLDGAGDPAERVLDGRLDVAVMSSPPPNRNLYLAPLGEDEMVLVTSPKNPLADKRSIRPHDLSRETLLIYPPRAESTLIRKVLEPAGIQPFRVMEIPLTEAIMEMVAAGTGVAFMAHWAAAPYVAGGRVVALPLCDSGFHRHWYAVTLNRQPMAPFMKEFLNLLSFDCSKHMRRLSATAAPV